MQYRPAFQRPVRASQSCYRFSRLSLYRIVFCFGMCFGLLATVGWAQADASSANSKASQPARPMHIVPFGPPTPRQHPRAAGSPPVIPYWGGPVISNIHVVEVFWGSFVDAGTTNGLQQFFTDVTNSSYFDLLNEYSTLGLVGQGGAPGTNQAVGRGVFDGKFTITPSVCPGGSGNPTCTLTDTQIQNELLNQRSNLPAPVVDSQGHFNSIYLIYFPPGVHILLGNAPSCANGGFCAYHSSTGISGQPNLPYGVFPDFGPTSACSQGGCGVNTAANDLTSATSHEIGEAVSDVQVNLAPNFAPPLAWSDGPEIGDLCNQQQTQISAGGNTYTVQKMWSNLQNGCVAAPADFVLTTATDAVPGKAFNLTVTADANGTLPLFNDTVHFTSSDAQAVLPADYTFDPAADNGAHTFSVTLKSLGSQTISVADTRASVITGKTTISVSHNPDLTIASTHAGNFTQGQTGAAYMLTALNDGDLPTAGTATVTDTLPSDLTATAISGTGWACTLATLTCTRADALAAGASYPPITLRVNVSTTAAASIVNMATVSGGGEVNTFNDVSRDPTTVVQLGDLSIMSADGGGFSQGQIGATYTLTANNVGNGPTAGLVKVVDALPAGLTATGMAGAGWTCVLGTLSCTRSDVLAPGGFYPAITVTVNVSLNAPSTVTNTATVSGGGEVNTANDVALDVTSITGPVPDLTVTSSHSGKFTQGQSGNKYSLVVSNIGPQATSGAVTVSETMPTAALISTGISGSGWTCTLATFTCTRNDVLPPGPNSSYPAITVTVTALPSATGTAVNTAMVSGGGELNTANDQANDLTDFNPHANVGITAIYNPFSQGQIGAIYAFAVYNDGGLPTSGTVTFTDTLPAGLTATGIGGTGWNCTLGSLTCSRNDPLATAYPFINLTVNVAANAPSSVTNVAVASWAGDIYPADNTSTDPTTIVPLIAVSGTGAQTVKAGGAAVFGFTIVSALPGTVNLSCSGLPNESTCSFNPASVTGTASTTLTISTTAPSAGAVHTQSPPDSTPLSAVLFPILGLAVLTLGLKKPVRVRLRLVTCAASLAIIVSMSGCGGSSSGPPPPPPNPGTTPGTYTIAVTANNPTAGLQGTTTVTLTVQ